MAPDLFEDILDGEQAHKMVLRLADMAAWRTVRRTKPEAA